MACALTMPEINPVKTPTKEVYKSMAFLNALLEDAGRSLERVPAPQLGKHGNTKIHARGTKAYTLVYSGLAWHDCMPTAGCGKCYAMKFHYLNAAAKRRGTAWLYSYMARYNLDQLRWIIRHEIMESSAKAKKLGLLLAVRIHEAGDFISPEHVNMWHEIATEFKNVVFWCYTRSDNAGGALLDSIVDFAKLDNVHCRASFDPVKGNAPIHMGRNGLPGAIIVGTKRKGKRKGPEHVKGAVNCPEQVTNGEIGCADCGLCWNKNKPVIRFWAH